MPNRFTFRTSPHIHNEILNTWHNGLSEAYRADPVIRQPLKAIKRKAIRAIDADRRSKHLVNFMICGTQKGGTSALHAYLREHPHICMSDTKEVHFFDNEYHFQKKRPRYSEYHSFFQPHDQHQLVGESTPIYMYWRDAPRRIWEYNPHMKVIVILRNPVDRAYSHWNMERSRGNDYLPFYEAIKNEEERCREALPYQHRIYSYIDRGYYLEQLRRLWAYFSRENVLVLKNEHLKEKPTTTLRRACKFLCVDEPPIVERKKVHARPYRSSIKKKEKAYLQSIFEHEIQALEHALDWDCSDWLD